MYTVVLEEDPAKHWHAYAPAVPGCFGGGRTRAEALRFYTINNARLHFEERDKGSIEVGKLADLILVDRDPLSCPEDEIKDTQVLWTMVGGRVVYRSE